MPVFWTRKKKEVDPKLFYWKAKFNQREDGGDQELPG